MNLNPDLNRKNQCSHTEEKQEKYLRLTYPKNNVALLTIKTFNSYDLARLNEDYIKFLQSAFKKLKDKQTGKLIIDLRGNGGE